MDQIPFIIHYEFIVPSKPPPPPPALCNNEGSSIIVDVVVVINKVQKEKHTYGRGLIGRYMLL